MIHLGFPVLGALVVFAAVVPLTTLLARLLLAARARSGRHPAERPGARWLAVVAPVLAPAVWFASAGLHQVRVDAALAACLHTHLGDDTCRDVLLFSLVVLLLPAAVVVRRAVEAARRPAGRALPAEAAPSERLSARCARYPALAGLAGRVVAVREAAHAVCTRGLLAPRIEVDAAWMAGLPDDALDAALLHEAEHVRGRDPLRGLLAAACLTLNPLAGLLRPELGRWRLAREMACDRAALEAGAARTALADAIVAAARPRQAAAGACCLSDGGVEALRLRVHHVLEGGAPIAAGVEVPGALLAPLVALAVLPHALGAAPLDRLHLGVEHALGLLGLL